MEVFVLRATHTRFGSLHTFSEVFTSLAEAEAYLARHPEVTRLEINSFTVNPQ